MNPPSARSVLRLVQLPVPQPAWGADTGNVPLAAACLAAAVDASPATRDVEVELVSAASADRLGDHALAALLARDEPEFVGFSLALWNTERSLHVAREVVRRSPRTTILVGGPEVAPDNTFLARSPGWDVAVAGEAEELLPTLLARLREGAEVRDLPGVARRARDDASAGCVLSAAPPASFALDAHPSPWLAGLLVPDGRTALPVETVRGCRSRCSFCFYPRSSAVLRALDVPSALRLVGSLLDGGAREVSFLDPTFNHRPDLEPLLLGLAALHRRSGARFFAEVRAEGLDERQARLLAEAGFGKVEIGLQSVNAETLRRTRRGGNPALVAEAAARLRAHGVEVVVDLIVGLPGDGPDDVRAGVDFLVEHGLGARAQVFPLAVLPGTALRAGAGAEGLLFDERPPYHVRGTRTFDEAALVAALADAEDVLDRRLDEVPRPFLARGAASADPPDVFVCDLDRAAAAMTAEVARPGAAHVALWCVGRDLWAVRERLLAALDARLAVDPHAVLDVVLAPRALFPLDLIGLLRRRLDAAPSTYASRALRHRGEDGGRRIATVVGREALRDRAHLAAIDALVPVFVETSLAEALRERGRWGDELPGARVLDEFEAVDWGDVLALAAAADPEALVFADRRLEGRFVREVLHAADA